MPPGAALPYLERQRLLSQIGIETCCKTAGCGPSTKIKPEKNEIRIQNVQKIDSITLAYASPSNNGCRLSRKRFRLIVLRQTNRTHILRIFNRCVQCQDGNVTIQCPHIEPTMSNNTFHFALNMFHFVCHADIVVAQLNRQSCHIPCTETENGRRKLFFVCEMPMRQVRTEQHNGQRSICDCDR